MPEAVKTAAPARKRTPAKKVAPRVAAAVDEPTTEAPETTEATPTPATVSEGERITVTWDHVGSTKSWEKFQPPAGSGCAGNIYAPLGTTAVKTLFIK